MLGTVTIGSKTFVLTALEAAGIVCHRAGFSDVDAEPTGTGGRWKVTAKAENKTVSVTGDTLTAAVVKLIERVDNG